MANEIDNYVKMCLIESMDKHLRRINNDLTRHVQALPPSKQKDELINALVNYSKRITTHLSKYEWELIELGCEVGRLTKQNRFLKQLSIDLLRSSEQANEVLGMAVKNIETKNKQQ